MPNTLIPIQTYTLSATTASVTFSNIPQNYTDLKIVASFRGTTSQVYEITALRFNGLSTNLSSRSIEGSGSAASSINNTFIYFGAGNGASSTANTFSNIEAYIPNYTSSNQKSVSIDSVGENNATLAYMQLTAGLWTGTAAITSIEIVPSASFVAGSTFTLYGISNGVKATGGTLTVAGGYAYHTFTSTGSFLPNQQIKGAEVLVIAGGGGAASGGGGAGGLLYRSAQTLTAGNSYTAVVGAGGTAGYTDSGSGSGAVAGSDSVFSSLTATGGGKGGQAGATQGIQPGGSGGSGGGGAANGGGTSTGGTGTTGQGNNGGSNSGYTASPYPSGGGGGAATAGQNAVSSTISGAGGDGTSAYTTWHSITGTGVLSGGVYSIAGGGGGGGYFSNNTRGAGGLGGGGNGGQQGSATAGTTNTGSGGGGGSNTLSGAAGGSGLIIVRYPLS